MFLKISQKVFNIFLVFFFIPLEEFKTRFGRKSEEKKNKLKIFQKISNNFDFLDKNWSFLGPKIMFLKNCFDWLTFDFKFIIVIHLKIKFFPSSKFDATWG